MLQKHATARKEQTTRDSRLWEHCAVSLFIAVLVFILRPYSGIAEELGALGDSAASTQAERFTAPTFADAARFRLSPDIRLSDAPRVFDRRLELAQGQTAASGTAASVTSPAQVPVWGSQKSYLIPALEVVGFQLALNLFDRLYYGCCDYDVDLYSIKHNLHRGWNVDSDGFNVNQLGHPYQGSMYHGFARSAGLNYWQGLGYTFVGSLFWEIAGETTPPSRNDQISTGIGGSFLGEALFRTSNFWLEQELGSPFWRELLAVAISPPVGFNRLVFGDRFQAIYPSNDPEYYSRLHLGVVSTTQDRRQSSKKIQRHEGIVEFALDYGLPGKSDYTYDRPFDYFSLQAALSTAIGFESASTRGLLFGTDYQIGDYYRGLWGLYGNYTYLAPQVFRFASTGVSVGSTGEWRFADMLTLQGTGLLGVGYASVSTIERVSDARANEYGVAPELLLALRLIFADRVSLDVSGREAFISKVSGPRTRHDNVVRADASLTWRVLDQHAVSLRYQLSRRDFDTRDLGHQTQDRSTIGIFYTLLGRDKFGTGDWRAAGN
jgi:hypothetical protein